MRSVLVGAERAGSLPRAGVTASSRAAFCMSEVAAAAVMPTPAEMPAAERALSGAPATAPTPVASSATPSVPGGPPAGLTGIDEGRHGLPRRGLCRRLLVRLASPGRLRLRRVPEPDGFGRLSLRPFESACVGGQSIGRGRERVGGRIPLVGLVAELVPEGIRGCAAPCARVDVRETITGLLNMAAPRLQRLSVSADRGGIAWHQLPWVVGLAQLSHR
jgi:hypothetical protein